MKFNKSKTVQKMRTTIECTIRVTLKTDIEGFIQSHEQEIKQFGAIKTNNKGEYEEGDIEAFMANKINSEMIISIDPNIDYVKVEDIELKEFNY